LLLPSPPDFPFIPPTLLQLQQTRKYDTNLYTFGVEQTFWENLLSLELRVPVVTGLASKNTLSVGTPTGPATFLDEFTTDPFGNPLFNVTATPQNTLGHEDTEFGNLTLILKSALYRDRTAGLTVSGGLGVVIPTAEDTQVRLVDYASFIIVPVPSFQRERDVRIANETASLSPFLAALYAPNPRWFTQGFAAVEVPVGGSQITYTDHFILGANPTLLAPGTPGPAGTIVAPFTVQGTIHEQTLLHLDWNVGYWVYRGREDAWLSGIAPCFEVHYTSTLNNAERVQLPGNANIVAPNPANLAVGLPETGPVVGGRSSRVDIVDLTAGTTFALGRRTTLATAFTVPVTSGVNKVFDWEFQLQLNYYWGR
jgi:hypothetical protein